MKPTDIILIKSATGLGWVPITEETSRLPIRPNMLYIFTDGNNFAIGDSDKPEELTKSRYFLPTHMALIDKPAILPDNIDPSYVFTRLQQKERTCPDCAVRKNYPCDNNVPCCICGEKDCNSRQPCPRKESQP